MVKSVAKTAEFSALMSSGIESLSSNEKNWLRIILDRAGIPFKYTSTDDDLRDTAIAIADRAVNIR